MEPATSGSWQGLSGESAREFASGLSGDFEATLFACRHTFVIAVYSADTAAITGLKHGPVQCLGMLKEAIVENGGATTSPLDFTTSGASQTGYVHREVKTISRSSRLHLLLATLMWFTLDTSSQI